MTDPPAPIPANADADPVASSDGGGVDAAMDVANLPTSDPPAPPVSCTTAPRMVTRRDLGKNFRAPRLVRLDERRMLFSWSEETKTRAFVLDVVDDSIGETVTLDTHLYGASSYPSIDVLDGAAVVRFVEDDENVMRIYASGRWSPAIEGNLAARAKDGSFVITSDIGDRRYDPPLGELGPLVTRPLMASVADVPLSAGRILSILRIDASLNVSLHDGTHWSTQTLPGTWSYVAAGDDVIAWQLGDAHKMLPIPIVTRRLRLSAIEKGFEAPVVVSATPAGEGVSIPNRYQGMPAASVFVDGGTIHFAGAIAACETCAATAVDRVLGEAGWSPPKELGLTGATVGVFALDGKIVLDATQKKATALTPAGWSRVFDFTAPDGAYQTTWHSSNGMLYVDAWNLSPFHQWMGAIRLGSDATALSWIDLGRTALFSHYPMHGAPRFVGADDLDLGLASWGQDLDNAGTFVRFTSAPAVSVLRIEPKGNALGASVSPHAGLAATDLRQTTSDGTLNHMLEIDAWNDHGIGERSAMYFTGEQPAFAATRCGGVVVMQRNDGIWDLTRWSGE